MDTTYKLIGTDGNEYGPVTLEQARDWAKEGRLASSTQVLRSDLSAWSTAAALPELGVADQAASLPGQPLDAAEMEDLDKKIKTAGAWLYWIAGLSIINSVIILTGSNWGFVLGLTLTQVIDFVCRGIATEFGWAAKIFALVLDLAIAGFFVALGVLARRRRTWPFIVGLVLYGIDTLLTLFTGIWLGVIWHAWALTCIVIGLRAAVSWRDAPK
ncbi:MAG TPA: DUF4339 domain-containing protein [Verrucomicrobiae bacterium]|nr:DUF4339 domain-containing protein [Verrucomicrobiae bacterium]